MKKLFLLNKRPISLIVLGAIVGYFFSTPLTGILIAIGLIAFSHLVECYLIT